MIHASKRVLILLVLALMCGMLSVRVQAEEVDRISVGQTLTVTIDEPGETVQFRFVPEETGLYLFWAQSDGDTFGCLLDSQGNQLVCNDDGTGLDFRVFAALQAGETYFWEAGYWSADDTGTFSVTLEGLESTPITPGQTLTADIQEPGQIARFRFTPEHTTGYIFRAESDGDTLGILLDGTGKQIDYNDDWNGTDFQIYRTLQVGETYFLETRYYGSDATGSFSVTLEITHHYQIDSFVASTCSQWGQLIYRCDICGDSYTVETPPVHSSSNCDGCDITVIAQGQCGDDIYWYLTEDGCLILNGTGETWDFVGFTTEWVGYFSSDPEKMPVPWKDHYKQITSIRIDPGITYLGEYIFWALEEVEELTLPEGLIHAGNHWLDYCRRLQRLSVSSTVTDLGGRDVSGLNLRQIRFDGAPPANSLWLRDVAEGLAILYHSSSPGWEEAMETWTVPADARWLDMDGAIDPAQLSFDRQEYTLRTGESLWLTTNADPYVNHILTQWNCDTENVAMIRGLLVTGLHPGTTLVTLGSEDGTYSVSCRITVTEDPVHGDAVDGGAGGDLVSWCLMEDRTLVLNGRGKTWDFTGFSTDFVEVYPEDPQTPAIPWKDYYKEITAIQVSPEITYLGNNIFWALEGVEELILPEGLEKTGYGWLDYCNGLKRIHIPSTVTYLSELYFSETLSRQISFAGSPPELDSNCLMYYDDGAVFILYHSSQPGWDDAIAQWEVSYNTRWLDMDGAIDPAALAFDRSAYTLAPGKSLQLSTNADPYVDYLLTQWHTDSTGTLVLSNGTVTGLRPGTATVTVSSPDGVYSISCRITVTEPQIPDSRQLPMEGIFNCNAGDQIYQTWDNCITSYLVERPDGILEVIQAMGGVGLVLQYYDRDMNLVFEKNIAPEFYGYAAFYAGEEYYYLLSGQTNLEEDDDREVLRITRYTKDWQRVDHCSIRGANTTIPCDAGTAVFAEANGKLYLHTSHEMYRTSDGLNHQANMTYEIDFETHTAQYLPFGYVSHSFSQRIRAMGDMIYRVDHGDAYPRSLYITRMGHDEFYYGTTTLHLLEIQGDIGANSTGVTLGGLEISSTNCLVAGTSVDQSDPDTYDSDDMQNVFLAVTDHDLSDSRLIWLTEHPAKGTYGATTPQLVKIAEDLFLLMWEEVSYWNYNFRYTPVCTRAVLIDGEGNTLSRVVSLEIRLSDCQPIVTEEGLVTWFAAPGEIWEDTATQAQMYQLSWYQLLTDPDGLEATLGHNYTTTVLEPTCVEPGGIIYTCDCGNSYTDYNQPALGHDWSGLRCQRCGHRRYNPFTDVPNDAWYLDPVFWADENGITSGTGGGKFSPEDTCTRAQVVTFLWRAMGQPEPESDENPFSDVAADAYYYDAVLWAVENGITSGTGGGKFSPDDSCTRAQVVTFLWRAMGKVEPESSENPFGDVKNSDYFFEPVLWAVENTITAGTGAGKFSPEDSCTRAQVVTFLYRAMANK